MKVPSAAAFFPFAESGKTMTPSSTLIRIVWNSLSPARFIQQPRLAQTSVTSPSTLTILPTYLSGLAISSLTFTGWDALSALP